MIRRVCFLLFLMLVAIVAAADVSDPVVSVGLVEKISIWISVFTSAVGTFALIAAITPTDRDDRIVGRLMKIVDFLGARNIGGAKNKNGDKK